MPTRKRRPTKKQDNGLNTASITFEECSNNPDDYVSDMNLVLKRLKKGSLTCKQARDELEIYSLPQRIYNLRDQQHNIITESVVVTKNNRKCRVAKYKLIVQEVM